MIVLGHEVVVQRKKEEEWKAPKGGREEEAVDAEDKQKKNSQRSLRTRRQASIGRHIVRWRSCIQRNQHNSREGFANQRHLKERGRGRGSLGMGQGDHRTSCQTAVLARYRCRGFRGPQGFEAVVVVRSGPGYPCHSNRTNAARRNRKAI